MVQVGLCVSSLMGHDPLQDAPHCPLVGPEMHAVHDIWDIVGNSNPWDVLEERVRFWMVVSPFSLPPHSLLPQGLARPTICPGGVRSVCFAANAGRSAGDEGELVGLGHVI
eukprot:7503706-Alexandrium_andersonii.AAC.1